MKKLIYIILLIGLASFGQSHKVQIVKYVPITTVQRDALTPPSNERWKIWNSDVDDWNYWNGTAWTIFSGGGSTDLNGLTDVVLATPLNGQTLTYDGTNWINQTPASGVTDHLLLSNIGTNTHPQIDTHIANGGVHFLQSAISITNSQVSDLQAGVSANTDLIGKSDNSITFLAVSAPYSTANNQADINKTLILSAGTSTITLDDTGLTVGFRLNFYNNSGASIAFALAAGDSSIQALSALDDGNPAYITLSATNTWQITVGGSGTDLLPLSNVFTGALNTFKDIDLTLTANKSSITSNGVTLLGYDSVLNVTNINDTGIQVGTNYTITPQSTNTVIDNATSGKVIINRDYAKAKFSDRPLFGASSALTAFDLNNTGGVFYTNSANSNTTLTTANLVIGGFVQIWINTVTEPTINGNLVSTGIPSTPWASNTDFDLIIGTHDGVNIYYYLLQRMPSVADVTPPTLSSIVIEDAAPTDVVMTFNESVTGTNLGFTIAGTTSTTFASISGSGITWTGVLGTAAANGETITLSYASATGDFTDTSSNALADITTQAVTNNISGGGTAPLLLFAFIPNANPNQIHFVFDQSVSGTNGGFVVSNTTSTSFSSMTGFGTSTLVGTLGTNITVQEGFITFSYTSSSGDLVGTVGSVAVADTGTETVENLIEGTGTEVYTDSNAANRVEANLLGNFIGVSATAAIESTDVNVGSFAMKGTATATGSTRIQSTVSVDATKVYKMTWDAKQTIGTGGYFSGLDGGTLLPINNRTYTTEWRSYGKLISNPTTKASAIRLYISLTSSVGDVILIDNLSIKEVP